ncbi:DUF5996 family protein [Streptacidiphilus sp. P02-A3a]|uniref:DUF5996 family protein n=1 Tax=Streptacidiphilus sp. P02-A3a TaxID=2704468 RepID=UPI0015FDD754|nr:DUF5996 family protein [Streptacidiphilus sp. P02-A3a]QMU70685.1 hypothetical protein GXP74_23230 [Streptacidiphilus sp. P02-A3a]
MELFPPLPLESWRDTKETLHRFAQVVGKLRLAGSTRRNHWWNVPFHLTGQGITTRPMGPTGDGDAFCVDFDLVAHRLVLRTLSGREESFPLAGHSVARFYQDTMDALDHLGIEVEPALCHPYDLPDAARPFADDDEHHSYDPAAVNRYWVILSQVALLLEQHAAGYSGKTSPVHHFWHTFDLAVTRFSDRVVEPAPDADPVTREAYSREVISAGFWFGDDNVPAPAFYSYTAPEPPGLADRPLRPPAATWTANRGAHLAVLGYEDVRAAADPWQTALDFLDSAYRAGAELAGWPRARECPGGVTDPRLGAAARG